MKSIAVAARALAAATAAGVAALALGPSAGAQEQGMAPVNEPRNLVEASVTQLQDALQAKTLTSEQLVQKYLARVAAYDRAGPSLHAFLRVNERALEEARRSDERRAAQGARGPLEGIPVLLKDNVDTADLPTTAGSVALAGSLPPDDAFLVRKLRAAGAVVLGKASLTEFANFISDRMPSGYSSLGGFGFNPFDPRPAPGGDGRPVLDPGGSSSGSSIAVSANLTALAVGTETSGSILSPASANGIVGIKPTLGLISRDGVIPITGEQDTPGPLGRSVRDAALLLGVLAGADDADAATSACREPGRCFEDYTQFLDANALQGARIGVPPFPPDRAEVMAAAMAVLRERGAQVERIPAFAQTFGVCTSVPAPANCSTVLLFGFKHDLNAYLAATPGAPVRSLAEIIAWNERTPGALMYGQSIALAAQRLDTAPGSADAARFAADRAQDLRLSRGALDAVYRPFANGPGTGEFDAIVFPDNLLAALPAKAGYPSIAVPAGVRPSGDPNRAAIPSGITFSGPPFSEPRLLALAFAFEQATRLRRAPPSVPPLPSDALGAR